MARGYRLAKRGESADQTRRRIVQATFELHGEQGIAATTMKQIAARAGVSVGSVYHHFPTYDDAINACGAHAFSIAPVPTAEIFQGATTRAERVRRLATAMFAMFAGLRGGFASVLADQDKLPVLRPFAEQEQAVRIALAAEAVGDAAAALPVAALVAHGPYDAFMRLGFTPEAAARTVADVANAWLDTQSLPMETPDGNARS